MNNPVISTHEDFIAAIAKVEDRLMDTTNKRPPYEDRARSLVFDYVTDHLEKTDSHVVFLFEDVYVVWFSKTLQNWKALLSTTLPDGMYYEVTYNGDKQEAYIDAYKKFKNVVVKDE